MAVEFDFSGSYSSGCDFYFKHVMVTKSLKLCYFLSERHNHVTVIAEFRLK